MNRIKVKIKFFKTTISSLKIHTHNCLISKYKDSSLNFRIDRSIKYQNIIGFGGAITDAASYNVYSLSTHTIQNLLNSYFDKSGIEYSVIRVPVAGFILVKIKIIHAFIT